MSRYDVVVVGGGIIGLTTAWRALSEGLSVALLDEHLSPNASSVAAGMLAPVAEVTYGEEALLQLGLVAVGRYPSFVAEIEDGSGLDCGYRRTGTLVVARDLDDMGKLSELFAFQQSLGLSVHKLRGAQARDLEPALVASARGALLVEGDHSIDNRALVRAVGEACVKAGICHKRQSAVEVAAGGVRTSADEVVRAETVVLAAGSNSPALSGMPPEVASSIRPVKGQLLYLSGPAEPALLSMTVRGSEVYLVPRQDGRLIVGGTVEEAGFDTRVTAGGVFELLRSAYELVPGITELELTDTLVGLRPASVDNAPLIGETSVPGLFAATGHYRNGILLAPVTADALVERLVTGVTPELIEPFSPLRFAA